MGVQGLWELLAPVGRRVSVEALSGRKLAIDASIWIIQFMKAMRDEKGDMIRNAHLIGFFRRICKLLYLRAKPVFVFDGGTPALKRRTVTARRRQRERAQSNIRKTAEKLLLNHLRTRKLDEIAQNIGLAQSVKEQRTGNIGVKKQGKVARSNMKEKEGSSEVSEIQDISVEQPLLLPEEPSMTHDTVEWTAPLISEVDRELIMSDSGTVNNASDDSDDNSEEYFMPPTQGRVDPAVLASLPPSMQLNLLVQMREQLVTDNRKKFQKVAKNPASFSQMQIQAYLKTVAFRRDINQVQKAAAGKGIGGIPSARIASEVDREYIFSTTFKAETQAAEADKVETHNASRIDQDNLDVSRSKQPQERLPERVDIDQSEQSQERLPEREDIDQTASMSENIILQKASTENVPDEDESLDIEWEDGDDVMGLMTSQPVKGAVITIEIDQNDLLAEGFEEDIEWEDGVSAMDCIDSIETKDTQVIGGGSPVECEIGTGFLISKERSVGSPEIVDKTLMEIEAAEVEEAIRQSLQDHTGCKAPKLVIRDESTMEFKQNEKLPPDIAFTEAPLSEEAFLAHERERKGKAIVDDYQAVRSGDIEEGGTLAFRINELEQASDCGTRYAESCKPSILELDNAPPSKLHTYRACDETIQAHADDLTTNFVQSKSCKPLMSKVDIAAPSEGHISVVCDEVFHSNNQTTHVAQSEGECGVKVEASICEIVEVQNESKLDTKPSSLHSSFPYPEQAVEERTNSEGMLQAARELQASVDTIEAADTITDAVMEHEKNVPSSLTGSYTGAEDDHLEEALLKEAEEVDLAAEREAFAKRERDLLAEREELSRQQAELQAEMEAEQAVMQDNLQEERDLLLQEEMELRAAQRKNERNAESVSGEMFSECQELLQMFGLPYIIAPMEAEAQCAYMDTIGLVDGVVTEDCDVFLFGGRNVFKNIFDDRKYVETYYMKDVESELGLDQEKLIHMALLLGSDYTEGISGIGIVNAIEVVNAFQGEAGLQKFKEWLDAPDYTLLNKFRQDGQKKQTKKKRTGRQSEAEDNNGAEEPDDISKDGSQSGKYDHRQQDFMDKHRAVSKNWNVPETFPNPMVINAYVSPQVDKSTEPFTWGKPDLEALRRICLERFGWNKSKSDELLLPVLKEYDRHETQLRLEAFYSFNQRFAKIRSKRIQKAVTHVTGRRLSSELVDFPKEEDSEESSPTRGEAKGSRLKNDASNELEPPTKAFSRMTASLKRRKNGDDQEVATRGRGRGRGRTASSRGRARGSKRSVASLTDDHSCEGMLDVKEDDQEVATRGRARGNGRTASSRGRVRASERSEASLSDERSSEGMLDLDDKERMDGAHVTAPRRSSRLPERAVYNFSGSEDDSDGGLRARLEEGGSPGQAGSILPLEVKEPGEPCVPSTDRTVEADLDKDGEEIGESSLGTDVVNHQYGLQEQKGEDYLVMGGGFCTADDDSHQELSIEKEGLALDNNLNIVPEESTCPDTRLVGSNPFKAEVSNSETAGHLSGVEATLHAVPFLRRKKRRVG